MFEIKNKIKLEKCISVYKKTFVNDEMFPLVKTRFFCSVCHNEEHIEVTPYSSSGSGFPFHTLYEEGFLKRETILKEGMAKVPFFTKDSKYLLVRNLPTLYYGMYCKKCFQQYIVVYGLGEQQPGKDVCEISGVWSYTEIKNKENETKE